MKHQRLEHKVFIEALGDSGLVDRNILEHVFDQAVQSHELVSEILVREDMISDYELANIACRTFSLPFVHVFGYQPNSDALNGLDPNFLRSYGLVPLDRFGKVLTVAMPGMVPSAVLEVLLSDDVSKVLAVVGSVVANREWLEQNLPGEVPEAPPVAESVPSALPATPVEEVDEWAAIFDAGEEAVQFNLQDDLTEDPSEGSAPALSEPAGLVDLTSELDDLPALEVLEPEMAPMGPSPGSPPPAAEVEIPDSEPPPEPEDPLIELDL